MFDGVLVLLHEVAVADLPDGSYPHFEHVKKEMAGDSPRRFQSFSLSILRSLSMIFCSAEAMILLVL
jgi:hypothetical protein